LYRPARRFHEKQFGCPPEALDQCIPIEQIRSWVEPRSGIGPVCGFSHIRNHRHS
jgi:hypothetical protein